MGESKAEASFRHKIMPYGYSRIQNKISDKYIRNEMIRENFKALYFDVGELIMLIHYGYANIRDKLNMIRTMLDDIEYLRKYHSPKAFPYEIEYTVDEYLKAAEAVYAYTEEMIYTPHERLIYIAEYPCMLNTIGLVNNPDDVLISKTYGYYVYDSVQEIFDEMRETCNKSFDSIHGCDVTVIAVPTDNKHREILDFTIHMVDGEPAVIQISPNDYEIKGSLGSDTFEIYESLNNHTIEHERLPYENGSIIQLQTPLMKEPFIGRLYSEQDLNGCWYNFLYGLDDERQEKGFIDLSYHVLNVVDYAYNSWDWIQAVK